MADEIGPVIQYLLDPIDAAAGHATQPVQAWLLRAATTDANLLDEWLSAHRTVRVIQVATGSGDRDGYDNPWITALVLYRELVDEGEQAADPAADHRIAEAARAWKAARETLARHDEGCGTCREARLSGLRCHPGLRLLEAAGASGDALLDTLAEEGSE